MKTHFAHRALGHDKHARSTLSFARPLALLTAVFAFDAGAQLIEATEAGNRAEALKLLESGSEVNEQAPDGTTPLMWAAYHGDVELVRRLLEAGAAVDARNRYGASALSEAATIGSAPLIAALLEAGAAANAPNPEGETPLMVVARTGNVEAATLLLNAGAEVDAREEWGGQTALMWAAAQSQAEMVRLLVSKRAEVDARAVVRNWPRKVVKEPRPKDMNRGGLTPLLYAAREGCLECARHLLEGGADPDLADPENVTALSLAIQNLHFDLAAYLIEAGADVNKWDLFGRAPLYMAVDVNTLPTDGAGGMAYIPTTDKHTALDIGKMLLERGANPNLQLKRRPPYLNVAQDRGADTIFSQGATPLLRAARAGDAEFVKLLLEHGALADLPMAYGVTPLMAASGLEYSLRVTRGRYRTDESVLATLELLVEAGADVNARMLTEPFSGLNYAGQISQPDFRYASRGRQVPGPGAKPHRTALHGAAMRGFTFIVQFLAEHGAHLEVKDADGKTPLDLASGDYTEYFLRQKAEPHKETVALLEKLLLAKD